MNIESVVHSIGRGSIEETYILHFQFYIVSKYVQQSFALLGGTETIACFEIYIVK